MKMSKKWHPSHPDRICQVCDLDMLPTTIHNFAYGRTEVNGHVPLCWTCYWHPFSTRLAIGTAGDDRCVMMGTLQSLHISTAVAVFNGAKLPGTEDYDAAAEGSTCYTCGTKGVERLALKLVGEPVVQNGVFVRNPEVKIPVCGIHFAWAMELDEGSS